MLYINMIDYSGTYTDYYQLTMAQGYFLSEQRSQDAVFDYFFRRLPFGSGYAVFAGLQDLLEALEKLCFNQAEIDFLRDKGFNGPFLEYLKNFRFRGNIYSAAEGDLIFPFIPVMQVEANIIEAQVIETLLLNILNFQTLIATKASRIRYAAGSHLLIDFGLRRAQGPGGLYATRAAFIGGFEATSNVMAGMIYGIPVMGSMGHSFIESHDDELAAFEHFSEVHPDECILLLDTYDTLKSGLPNAIRVARRMESRGQRLRGVRIDSGDLAFLSRSCRSALDDEGLGYVKISASNNLDEFIIKSLIDQNAPIDSFGVGTKLVTGNPEGALDGVYKLAFSAGKPRIKLTENISKMTFPHRKQVLRITDDRGKFIGADAIVLSGEKDAEIIHHPLYPFKSLNVSRNMKEELLQPVMINGIRSAPPADLPAIAKFSQDRLGLLPPEFKRFDNPHTYKVSLSSRLLAERNRMVEESRKRYESTGNS